MLQYSDPAIQDTVLSTVNYRPRTSKLPWFVVCAVLKDFYIFRHIRKHPECMCARVPTEHCVLLQA